MSTTAPESTEASRIAAQPFGDGETPAAPPAEFDDVVKHVQCRVWKVEGDVSGIIRGNQEVTEHIEREFEQKPLSYNTMVQFTGLIGRAIDDAMSGPEGLSLESVAEIADVAQSAVSGQFVLSRSDFAGIDGFIRGFAKLAAYAPGLMDEAQCIWLRVPMRDRMIVREIWGKPVDEGGLSMAEGEEMLTLFIQQNYEELERFLVERLRRVGQAIQKERKRIHPDDPQQ